MNRKTARTNRITVVLCPSCAESFYNSRENGFIRRVDPYQAEKEVCSYCGLRLGWDYIIQASISRKSTYVSKKGGGRYA